MCIRDRIDIAQKIILNQRRLSFSSHIHRKRNYSAITTCSKLIPLPNHVHSDEDLQNLFKPFLDYIEAKHKTREGKDRFGLRPTPPNKELEYKSNKQEELHERIIQTGSQVSVQWVSEELLGTDWKCGWYKATVNCYDHENDVLTLTYSSEPGIPYEEELFLPTKK